MMFLALNQQRGDFWPSLTSCGILRIQSIILPRIRLVAFYFIIIEFTMATDTVCDPCHSSNVVNTSVSWCMECEEELCFECAEYHTKLKMARNHHFSIFQYTLVRLTNTS
jgi:hypothetical protein